MPGTSNLSKYEVSFISDGTFHQSWVLLSDDYIPKLDALFDQNTTSTPSSSVFARAFIRLGQPEVDDALALVGNIEKLCDPNSSFNWTELRTLAHQAIQECDAHIADAEPLGLDGMWHGPDDTCEFFSESFFGVFNAPATCALIGAIENMSEVSEFRSFRLQDERVDNQPLDALIQISDQHGQTQWSDFLRAVKALNYKTLLTQQVQLSSTVPSSRMKF